MKNKIPTPEISIILPVFNVEKYLEQCLDSLLCQIFQNFEIIAIEDGGNDKCLSILRSYSQKDNRIKVYSQRHKGAGFTRNRGIKLALGKYLVFCDSDDFFEPTMLEELYLQAEKKKSRYRFFTVVVSHRKYR